MAGSLGSLVIEMAANTARLQGDLGKAVSLASGAAGRISSAFSAIGVGLFSGGVVAGLAAMAKSAISYGDDISKGAQRAGIAAAQFSELAAAAKNTDVEITSLTKGLKEIGTTISSAFDGNKSSLKTLDQLGLSLSGLRSEDATQQLLDVADALNGVQNPTDRTRLGTELLGKAYLDLVPLLSLGSKGLRTLIDDQKKLGNTLSNEQAAKLAAADDAIKRMTASFHGMATTLIGEVSPALTTFFNAVTRMTTANPESVSTLKSQLASIEHGYDEMAKLVLRKKLLAATLKEIDTELVTPPAAGGTAYDPAAAAAAKIQAAQALTDAMATAASKASSRFNTFSEIKINSKWLEDYVADLTKMEESTRTSTEKQVAAWDQFEQDVQKLVKLGVDNGGISAAEGLKRWNDYADQALSEFEPTVHMRMTEPVKKAADEMSEYAKQAAHNIQDAFAQFLFDPFKDGINGLLTGFLNAIRQMLANAAAAKLSEALFGKDGGGSGGILGSFLGAIIGAGVGGGSTAAAGASGSFFSSPEFGGHRAMGGPVATGKTYMVGENGPEWFTPSRSGYVNANGSGAGDGGDSGPAVVVNYRVDARGATTDLAAALPGILKQHGESIKGDIIQGIRRKKYPI